MISGYIRRAPPSRTTMEWEHGDGEDGDWAARFDSDAVPLDVQYQSEGGRDEDLQAQAAATSNKREGEPQRAVLGDQCPICLHALDDPAMVQGCFHVYCHACIAKWVRNLALHGVRTPTCPLCKQSFSRVYTDVVSETDYHVIHFGSNGSGRKQQTPLIDGLLRRSMVYRQRMRIVRVNGVDVSSFTLETAPRPVKTQTREYAQWMERELRACVGPDIDLTVFTALVGAVLGSPVQRNVNWNELQTTLEPFLLDDSAIFVRELSLFMSSRLNMQAYDDVVEYCCSGQAEDCVIDTCCGKSI